MIFPYRDNIPSRTVPFITISLVVINVLMFIFELSLSPRQLHTFVFEYGFVPAQLIQSFKPVYKQTGVLTSIFTSMFLHGGIIHLVGNMWWLWIFGDNVEDRLGHLRFCFFYILSGVSASLIHAVFNLDSQVPSIGASGAISGVLGAYMITFPTARVHTLLTIVFFWTTAELPAIIVLGFWFIIQLFSGTTALAVASHATSGTAWWAHIGGFLTGIFLMKVFVPRRHTGMLTY